MSLDVGVTASEPRLDTRDKTFLGALVGSQAFWVTIALVVISGVMSIQEPVFASEDNFFNITRNFAFIGIMALGLTPVIITGGIDLSVGSVMGVVAIVCGLVLLKQPIPWMPDWWNDAAWTQSLITKTRAAGLIPYISTIGLDKVFTQTLR